MKRVILMVAISAMITGCAQVGNAVQRRMTSSIDLAKQDCVEMGFFPGTAQYQNCVMVTTQNIRANREQEARDSEAARLAVTPRTIQCGRVGSYINCIER